MKSDVDLNRLLLGGIEGTHYELDADGNRVTLDKAVAYGEHCDEMEFIPEQTGFTFDPSPVQNQYTAVQSVVSEYQQSFALGIYGKDTEKSIEEFHQALKDAGVDAFTEEFIKQYTEYKAANGI